MNYINLKMNAACFSTEQGQHAAQGYAREK
jgi:hypothetical protein